MGFGAPHERSKILPTVGIDTPRMSLLNHLVFDQPLGHVIGGPGLRNLVVHRKNVGQNKNRHRAPTKNRPEKNATLEFIKNQEIEN